MKDYTKGCGRRMGHNENCSEGWTCESCNDLIKLQKENGQFKGEMKYTKALEELFELIKEDEPYAHFEIGYNRKTDYMAWICSRCIDDDPNRKVYACGQGDTIEEACFSAMTSYKGRH